MKQLTADEFYTLALKMLTANPSWRYGQALFNALFELRPDLAEQVRGTDKDPFYVRGESGDKRLYAFGEFINKHLG